MIDIYARNRSFLTLFNFIYTFSNENIFLITKSVTVHVQWSDRPGRYMYMKSYNKSKK